MKRDVLKDSIDALFHCPRPFFTREEYRDQLVLLGYEVVDIDKLLSIFLMNQLIIKEGETYRITLERMVDLPDWLTKSQ